MKIKVGIADNDPLYMASLNKMINRITNFEVILESLNGDDLLETLEFQPLKPDILLIDFHMLETAQNITRNYPLIKMAALALKGDELTIIKMIRAGCRAYIFKDVKPEELENILLEIFKTGYYNADAANINYKRIYRMIFEKKKY